MNLELSTLDASAVSRFDGFYMLQTISPSDGEILIRLKTIDGDVEPPFKYEIVKTNDNRAVVCFNASFPNLKFNNLVAMCGDLEEVVNLQIFERLRRYYKLDGRNDNKSHFFFYNSVPITSEVGDGQFNIEERCHLNLLGPETFMKNDAQVVPLVDYKHIYVYEPILSVNGTAHFGYANTNTDIEWYSNQDPFPRITFTLQEGLKQIAEWAAVTTEPWGNAETIASKAAQFLEQLQFSQNEIQHIHSSQPDMQIFKYISGDENARTRPEAPGPLTADIENTILRRLSHMSILNFVRIHNIDIDDDVLNECIDVQNRISDLASSRVIHVSELIANSINEDNVDSIKTAIFKKGRIFTSEAIMADVILSLKKLNER